MGRALGYLGGPSVMRSSQEKQGGQSEGRGDVMRKTRGQETDRLEDALRLVLKMEEEAMSQGVQITFLETRKGKEMDSSPYSFKKGCTSVDPFWAF